jgi:hypothetical protein
MEKEVVDFVETKSIKSHPGGRKVKVEDVPRGRLKTFSHRWCVLGADYLVRRRVMLIYMNRAQAEEYCGPYQLSRITPFALSGIKNPYFLLLQKMFNIYYRCLPKRYYRFNLEKL